MKGSTIRTICYSFIGSLFIGVFVAMVAEPKKEDIKPTRYDFDNLKPAPWMDEDDYKPDTLRGPIIQHNATHH